MALRFKAFTPQAYEAGSWITWTDADGTTRHGQIIDQGPEAGLWWLTSLTADDHLETLLLHRLPNTTKYARLMRDERLERGEDEHLYQVRAAKYYLDHRGDMRALYADVIAPAVSCQEPEAESLARNGQTVIPLDDAADDELFDDVPGVIAGPGVLVPGVRVQYLPEHQPGPRTRHCRAGVIVSVGTTCVRWRPFGGDKDVRTPLEHMRVNVCSHVNDRVHVRRMIEALDAGRKLPRWPGWCRWSLARHAEYAAGQMQVAVQPPAAPAPGPLVVIPCGSAKLAHAAPAGEMYTGGYARACARAASALTATGGTVLILSALYGLTPLDRVIEPYELRMGQPGSVTGEQLREQARALGVDRAREVVVLAGAAYTAAARQVWPDATAPLAGLPGMGYQLQRLAALAGAPGDTPRRPATSGRESLTRNDTPTSLVGQLDLPNSGCVMSEVSGRALGPRPAPHRTEPPTCVRTPPLRTSVLGPLSATRPPSTPTAPALVRTSCWTASAPRRTSRSGRSTRPVSSPGPPPAVAMQRPACARCTASTLPTPTARTTTCAAGCRALRPSSP